jgi:membrane-associated phospholipid phosphatase
MSQPDAPDSFAGDVTLPQQGTSDLAKRVGLISVAVFAILFYFVINSYSIGRQAWTLETFVDDWIPFSPPWQFFYFGYIFFLFIPILQIRDLRLLRRAVIAFVFVQFTAYLIFLLMPVRMERPLDFEIDGVFTWGIAFTFNLDPPYNCFPSLHLGNAVLTGLIAWRLDRKVGDAFLVGAGLIALSTMCIKQHYFLDVVAGAALAWIGYRLFFRDAVDQQAEPGQLYPRRRLLLIPALYLSILGGLYVAYSLGWQPFPWPIEPR